MPDVLYRDPFNPTLIDSVALDVSAEQNEYIKDVLKVACSDSKFAEKAYQAIALILGAGSVAPPVVTSLVPSTVVLGEPSFDIHVMGTGFNPYSVIVFNGYDEPTTFVSETELTTGVNMPLWQAPAVVPVKVRNFNVMSDPVDFSFTETAPITLTSSKKVEEKKESVKESVKDKK